MENKGTSRRSCIFCGSSENKISKEHVWPEWLLAKLPQDVLKSDFTLQFEDSVQGKFLKVPGQPIFNMEVSGTCRPCNSEWMSRIEKRVQPYVEGMLHGRGRLLHHEGQIAIARWGVLKSLVCQHAFKRPDVPIPSEHYHELYELRDEPQLPPATTVYTAKAGWSKGIAKAGFFRLHGINWQGGDERGQDNGYLITFTALDLVVQILRIYGNERAEFRFSPRLAESVAQIWPPIDSFVWPPGPALTHAGVMALAGARPGWV